MRQICLLLSLIFSSLIPLTTYAGIDRTSIAVLGITPGQSTFEDVQRLFGDATRWRSGDASTSETKQCFRIRARNIQGYIVFASNSEMAGPPSYKVTDIRIYAAAVSFADSKRCDGTIVREAPISTVKGIATGISKKAIEHILGKPNRIEDGTSFWVACVDTPLPESNPHYSYWSKRQGCFRDKHGGWKGKPYYNACSGVTVRYENGVAVFVGISSADSIC